MKTSKMLHFSAAAVAVTFLSGCGLHQRPHVEREDRSAGLPSSVTTSHPDSAHAAEPDGGEWVVAPGIVEPWGGETFLAAQEPGRIAALMVEEGDVVEAGQELAKLDDTAQRNALALAEAELAETTATFEKIEHGATNEELRQAQADFDAALARADFAQSAAGRVGRLHGGGSISDNDADRAASDARAQAALAESARARLEALTRGARAEERDAAHARLESARARVRMAEAALGRRSVVSPVGGTVLLSRLHVGEFYTPEAGPLVVVGDMSRMRVRIEVDEIDAPDVRVGAASRLLSDGGAPLGEGTVVRLAPRMGRRGLPIESPTARADVRVREAFVEIPASTDLVPGQRVWSNIPRPGVKELR